MLDVMVAYLWPEGSATLSFVGKENPSIGQFGLDLVFKTKDKNILLLEQLPIKNGEACV